MNIQEEIDFIFTFLRDRYLSSRIIGTLWGDDHLKSYAKIEINDSDYIDHIYESDISSTAVRDQVIVLIPIGNNVYIRCDCDKL